VNTDFSELAEFPFFGMLARYCAYRKEKLPMARQHRCRSAALLGLVGMLAASPVLAGVQGIEDPRDIRAAIEAAIGPHLATIKNANFDISVEQIDPRLRFPACPALTVTLPPANSAMISAKVTCESPAWTIYVPVHLHAWVEAVVAAANLVPNRALSANDLTLGRIDMFGAGGGLLTDPQEAEGKILRAGLTAGAPILSPLLDLPITVHRGQRVVLTLSDQTMVIKATALALEDGRIGDNISVQNPDSQKTLRATVDAEGGVELKF